MSERSKQNKNMFLRYDARITAKSRLFILTILGVLLMPSIDCAPRVSDGWDMQFQTILSEMGGSILEPLVRKCNGLSDVNILSGNKKIRLEILRQISGRIGPVDYSQDTKTKTTYSYGSVGRFEGETAWGTPVSGDIMGTRVSTKTKVLNYKAKTAKGFRKAFDSMIGLARAKHPRACAEVGACIFVDATKGMIEMDERKMLDYFKKAADGGDEDGMFMYAFCLYYGIGKTRPDLKEVYAALERLKDSIAAAPLDKSACRQCINSGWAFRRLKEF